MWGVDVHEYEGLEERASRVARPGEMKQKCNLSKFVSIVALRKSSGENHNLTVHSMRQEPGSPINSQGIRGNLFF